MMDDFEKQAKDADKSTPSDGSKNADQWDYASERFPRRPFPWEIFPTVIAGSLKQVARSCATSNVAMPGAALSIVASVLGRTISISAKDNWYEPAIFWSGDIRSSGEGKTPPVRPLLG